MSTERQNKYSIIAFATIAIVAAALIAIPIIEQANAAFVQKQDLRSKITSRVHSFVSHVERALGIRVGGTGGTPPPQR